MIIKIEIIYYNKLNIINSNHKLLLQKKKNIMKKIKYIKIKNNL